VNWKSPVRDLLEQLVNEMVARGVHFDDAQREFEKKFLARVIQQCDGNLCKAADTLGIHRNTLARKTKQLKIKARSL
jgi:DNA-binding protein Fis